ncbi:MAG TPA: hypothetical protein VKF17_05935 [Isosphaeraceae bacterium]|nr:hypothetical protein [Isosphaeraceae bacterium]
MVFPEWAGATRLNRLSSAPPPPAMSVTSRLPSSCDVSDVPFSLPNPMGAYVDPDAMIAVRAAGASVEEVHRRAYAGEFPPSKPMDPRVLL